MRLHFIFEKYSTVYKCTVMSNVEAGCCCVSVSVCSGCVQVHSLFLREVLFQLKLYCSGEVETQTGGILSACSCCLLVY